MAFFSCNVLNINSLECVSMNNQECKINKCKGSCNIINDPYAKLCVPDTIKNINVKVFNLMSGTNETRHIEWHKTCKCTFRLDSSVCNNKQRWNEDKCRCECKELIDKGICDKEFIWNPSNYECEWDKSCDIGEYLDYKNRKCRNKLVDKLVEECSENIDDNKTLDNETLNVIPLNDYEKVCNSCTIYIVLFAVFFITSICISSALFYFHWYLKKDNVRIKIYPGTQTTT